VQTAEPEAAAQSASQAYAQEGVQAQESVQAQENVQVQENIQTRENVQAQAPSDSKKAESVSALSIIGFVCAFIIPVAGLIMGIIDLCIKDGRKKALSIAAVVVSACFIGIFIVVMFMFVVPLTALLGIM